jgi:DNA-binding transcriptional LysR family regulator
MAECERASSSFANEELDLLAGTLVEVMPAWRSIELGVYAVYPSRRFVSPKVRLMIEFLVNAFRMRGWPA